MKSEKLDRKPIAAAIAASIIVLTFGLAYRVLAMKIESPVTSSPIASDALQELPMQIGDWKGVDVPMDDAIVRRTDSDAHINRRYSRGNGLGSVSLYICAGVNIHDLMIHRPQVCYRSAGWTLINHHSTELSFEDREKLPYSIYRFTRGDLNREEVTVLHYFFTDGQYLDNVSVLQRRLWKLFSSVPWVAQVQIAASSGGIKTNDTTINKIVSEFAVESSPSIAELFESIQNDQSAHSADPLKKEGGRQ